MTDDVTFDEITDQGISEFAYGVVRGVDPENVLETGTGSGTVTARILWAMARNGHGTIYTVERDRKRAAFVNDDLVATGVQSPEGTHWEPRIVVEDSLSWEPPDDLTFDLCWFDTGQHAAEFDHYRPSMRPGTVVLFASAGDWNGEGLAGITLLRVRDLLFGQVL